MFLKRTRDDVIFRSFPADAEVTSDEKYTYIGESRVLNSYLQNSGELVQNVQVPADFQPEKYKFVDGQVIDNPDFVDPEVLKARREEEAKQRRLEAEAKAAGFETVEEYLSTTAREQRDELLRQTDWRALQDVTLPQAWADYRQALRDIPQQGGFPTDITWPEKPQE